MKAFTFLVGIICFVGVSYGQTTITSSCSSSGFGFPIGTNDTVSFVIGYDLTMHYDSTKVQPTGLITVSSDLINPAWVDVINYIDTTNALIYISAFFNALAPPTANFQGTGNILEVEFNRTAGFGSVDTAIFVFPYLQESYINGVVSKTIGPGSYISYRDSIFTANLEYWNGHLPIRYDSLNPGNYLITNIYSNNSTCTNKSLDAVQPDTAGIFNYVILNGENINIEKDIAPTTDMQPVINGADALLVRKVLLNDAGFIPSVFQIIAMDVNLDGVISAGDVSQINQRSVLMIDEFRQTWNYNNSGVSNGQPSKDWLFIDSTVTLMTNPAYLISGLYPSNDGIGYSKSKVPLIPFCLPVPVTDFATCPIVSVESYVGILVGDVDGNYINQSNSPYY